MTATLISPLICPECETVRVRSPSGTVCPNGHGRIHPKASAGQLKTARRHQWASTLPVATKVKKRGRKYTIAGCDGEFVIATFSVNSIALPTCRVPTGATCCGGVLAVIVGSQILVRKFVTSPE